MMVNDFKQKKLPFMIEITYPLECHLGDCEQIDSFNIDNFSEQPPRLSSSGIRGQLILALNMPP